MCVLSLLSIATLGIEHWALKGSNGDNRHY
jgi:hypothetical protein